MTKKTKQEWARREAALREFVEKNHRMPETKEDYKGERLGKWCINQRTKYKDGSLSKDRTQLLEQIPGWTWENYKALQGFVEKKGRLPQ